MHIPPPSPPRRTNPGSLGGLASARRLSPEARSQRAARGGNATVRAYGLEHYGRIAKADGTHSWHKRRGKGPDVADEKEVVQEES